MTAEAQIWRCTKCGAEFVPAAWQVKNQSHRCCRGCRAAKETARINAAKEAGREWRYTDPAKQRARSLLARFTAASVPEPMSGCWLWLNSVDRWGYGRVEIGYRQLGAHRAAWELFRGTIPQGLLVLHRCDVPSCVNPDHLFLGTPRDNMEDAARKGRKSNKLTPEIVREIRRDGTAGATTVALAAKYRLSRSTVDDILGGKLWRHVQ